MVGVERGRPAKIWSGARRPVVLFLSVRPERFELPTRRFEACCSIHLSYEREKA